MEQRKLPFVWELNNAGVISHAIGCVHAIPLEIDYEADIAKYLQGKRNVLFERANWLRVEQKREEPKWEDEFFGRLFERTRKKFYEEFDKYGRLERTLQSTAKGLRMESLETKDEHDKYLAIYKKAMLELEVALNREELFLQGDEIALKARLEKEEQNLKQCLTPEEYALHKNRNLLMTERSLPYFAEPTIVAVGIGHLLAEPSMLTLYQEKEIKVKRIQ